MPDERVLDQSDIDKLMSSNENVSEDWEDAFEEEAQPGKTAPPRSKGPQPQGHTFRPLEEKGAKGTPRGPWISSWTSRSRSRWSWAGPRC